MGKSKQIISANQYGMLGTTARDEVKALVGSLSTNPLFDDVEQGALIIARMMQKELMGYVLEAVTQKVQGEKKMSALRVS